MQNHYPKIRAENQNFLLYLLLSFVSASKVQSAEDKDFRGQEGWKNGGSGWAEETGAGSLRQLRARLRGLCDPQARQELPRQVLQGSGQHQGLHRLRAYRQAYLGSVPGQGQACGWPRWLLDCNELKTVFISYRGGYKSQSFVLSIASFEDSFHLPLPRFDLQWRRKDWNRSEQNRYLVLGIR